MLNYEPRYGEYIILAEDFKLLIQITLIKNFEMLLPNKCFGHLCKFLIQTTIITLHNFMDLDLSIDLRPSKLSCTFQCFLFDTFLHT